MVKKEYLKELDKRLDRIDSIYEKMSKNIKNLDLSSTYDNLKALKKITTEINRLNYVYRKWDE